MRHNLLLLFIPLLLASCNKKEQEEIELAPPVTWEVHQQFTHNLRFITNLYGTDEDLFVLGLKFISRISHATEEEKMEHLGVLYYENMANYKFPLNAKVFVGTHEQILHFKLNENPVEIISDLQINMAEVDPDFRKFNLFSNNRDEAIALSDNNVALVPYTTKEQESRLLLVKFGVEKGFFPSEKISLKETKIIDLHNNGVNFDFITSFNSFFYVKTVNGLVRISEDGALEHVMSKDLINISLFKHKGNLYSTAWNIDRLSLYTSVDGRNWVHVTDLWESIQVLSLFSVSEDLLVAVYKSQLFELDLNTMQIRELDNTGLEGHYITSVVKVKDKVYVGTQSGLFSKDAAHLFTYKHEKGEERLITL